jgi:hypothetical protein
MFIWKVMFGLILLYRGVQVSIQDRYLYLIWPMISVILLCIVLCTVIPKVFIYNTLSLLTKLIILACSIVLGIAFQITAPVTADKKRKLIFIPGRYINLIPTLSFLAINYYVAYLRFTQKEFFNTLTDERQQLLIAFTTIMSIWIVMNICICYRYIRSDSTPIIIKNEKPNE